MAFGALSKHLFSIGAIYQNIVLALPCGLLAPLPFYFAHQYFPEFGFDYLVTPVLCYYLGFLFHGIHSALLTHFAIGFFVQCYIRKRYPEWFLKYNYLLAAAISGGTELLVFIATFAVQGASGPEVKVPPYFGNNFQKGNYDFCAKNHASGK